MRWWWPIVGTGVLTSCGPYTFHLPPEPQQSFPEGSTFPTDPDLARARIEPHGVVTCEDPGARTRNGPFDRRVAEVDSASEAYLWSGGVLAGDLDGDDQLDVIAPLEGSAVLYHREGSALVPRVDRLSAFDLSYGTGGSLADVEGDGDLDALILRYDAPAVMLRNDGAGLFTDVTDGSGLDIVGPATSSTWGDLDRDGDLDLFVGVDGYLEDQGPASSYLFENRGDGVFVDRSYQLPDALHQGYTRIGSFHDLDGDAWPELYVVNDLGSVQPNVLLRNVGGRLVPDDNASRLDLPMAGGGLGVGDVNGDGVLDFLIPQWNALSLMLSTEDGTWVDWAQAREMRPMPDQCVGWGAELADVDNDGDLDGIVAYGRYEDPVQERENPAVEPDALFLQQDDGTFVDVALEWGMDDPGTGRGVVVADFDGDGWLDVLKRELEGTSPFYVSRCGAAHWLEVALRDERAGVGNRYAIGATVRVFAEDGRSFVRYLSAGGTGYGSGGPPVLHFGLGEARSIDRIEVLWPDGQVSLVGFGSDADQMVTITRE